MIPQETADKLIEQRKADDLSPFYAHIYALYTDGGWSLNDIAIPLSVSKSTVGLWKNKYIPNPNPNPTVPVKPQKIPGTLKKITPDIPLKDQERIKELAELVKKRTRWSRKNAPEVLAARELETMIDLYIVQRGVSVARFAKVAGVSRKAIIQRMKK